MENRLKAVRSGGSLLFAALYDGHGDRVFQMLPHKLNEYAPGVNSNVNGDPADYRISCDTSSTPSGNTSSETSSETSSNTSSSNNGWWNNWGGDNGNDYWNQWGQAGQNTSSQSSSSSSGTSGGGYWDQWGFGGSSKPADDYWSQWANAGKDTSSKETSSEETSGETTSSEEEAPKEDETYTVGDDTTLTDKPKDDTDCDPEEETKNTETAPTGCGVSVDMDKLKDVMFVPNGIDHTNIDQYDVVGYINDINVANTRVLMEYGKLGGVGNVYAYGTQLNSVSMYNQKNYYMYDGRGSVSGLTAGQKAQQVVGYSYNEWGAVTSGNTSHGSTGNGGGYYSTPFQYNGEALDISVSLQYLRARYYDPGTKRFLQQDTVWGKINVALSQNLYAYVQNSPLNFTDPSGRVSMAVNDGGSGTYKDEMDSLNSIIETLNKQLESAVNTLKASTVRYTPDQEYNQKIQEQRGKSRTHILSLSTQIAQYKDRVKQVSMIDFAQRMNARYGCLSNFTNIQKYAIEDARETISIIYQGHYKTWWLNQYTYHSYSADNILSEYEEERESILGNAALFDGSFTILDLLYSGATLSEDVVSYSSKVSKIAFLFGIYANATYDSSEPGISDIPEKLGLLNYYQDKANEVEQIINHITTTEYAYLAGLNGRDRFVDKPQELKETSIEKPSGFTDLEYAEYKEAWLEYIDRVIYINQEMGDSYQYIRAYDKSVRK